MSDNGLPSQFVDESQNEELFNDALDLELFGDDNFGFGFDGEQGLGLPDESTNQQDVVSSETAGLQTQRQEVPSSVDVEPPLTDEDFLEPGDFVSDPQEGVTGNEALGQVQPQAGLLDLQHQPEADELTQGQLGLTAPQSVDQANDSSNVDQSQGGQMRGDDQAHPQPTELGVVDSSSTNLPTNGPTNPKQILEFDFGALDSEEWRALASFGADADIDDILGASFGQDVGTSSGHVEPLTAPRQGSPVNTPGFNHLEPLTGPQQRSATNTPGVDSGYGTAAMSRETTRGLASATPQPSNAVGRPGPGNAQRASSATNTAARPLQAKDHSDVDDHSSDESEDESEGSIGSDEVGYEEYAENDPLVIPDPLQDSWGRTGMRNGQEVWFNPGSKKWQPSASHHDMRATLIARAQAEYPNDRYLHPDPTDGILHGETAFFKPHQNWGPNRQQCADELFVWREYQPKRDENGKPLRKSKPKIEHPGFMFEGDMILLDSRNNPVVDHDFIPLTLAVRTDAGKLQEMALKPGCRQVDLWARMPRHERKNEKDNNSDLVPLRDKNTRINMPMTRWREKKGTIAGSDREGTDVIMDGLRKFYHSHGFDPVAAGNSVKAFPRDLEAWEVKEVRRGNIAQFGRRAGSRALDETTRAERKEKTMQSIQNGRKRQADRNGDVGRKRSRDDDEADSHGSGDDAQKRRRRDQEAEAGNAFFNARYNAQQGYPANGFQGFPHHQQGGYPQAMGPLRPQYSAYGPQYPTNYDRNVPMLGSFPPPAPNSMPQVPYGGVQMRATPSPYTNAQTTALLNNSLLNSQYHPEDRNPRLNTGVQSFGPRLPQQTSRFTMAQTPRISAEVQRQRHVENPANAPAPAGNTLAPGGNILASGGRRLQQVPQQVLGKRRQRDAPAFGDEDGNSGWRTPTVPNGSHGLMDPNIPHLNRREHPRQANLDVDFSPVPKRRRNNQDLDTEPRQQPQSRPERTSRPSQYGAAGAPTPLLPLDEGFGRAPPRSNSLGNAGGQLRSPATIAREIFSNSRPATGASGNHGINDSQLQQSGQHVPGRQESRQVLGKHRREDSLGQWGEDTYVPHQNLGQQDPGNDFGDLGQDISMPSPKRRRMATAEGTHAPPVRAPSARPVMNTRRRERDIQPTPLQPIPGGLIPGSRQTPQVLGAVHLPPQNIYTNNNQSGPIQNFDPFRASHPPQLPLPPQDQQRVPEDIRDRLPINGDESQSLDSALRYTREVFQEWTGQEAPVTNLEDSYNTQYREIRRAFRAWWRSEENPQRGEPWPELWRARRWTGSMDDWDAPEDGEHLREVKRNGKKAA